MKLFKRSGHKKSRFRILAGVVCLSVITGIAWTLFNPTSTDAAWFDDSYAYRQIFTFTHNAAITTDVAVTFSLDTAELIAAGVMQSDCDDTRFTDINGKVLRYQLTGTCNNAATTYEVVFPSIISGTNSAYVYYGNPSATSKSISVTGITALTPSGGDPAITTRTVEEKGSSPVLAWKFDEGNGSSVQDSTSNDNDGSMPSQSSSIGTAVKIDDAGDAAVQTAYRQVVRTSSGTLYAFINDSGSCEIWSSSDGTTWTEQDSVNNPTCIVGELSAAVDGSDNLHLAYESNGGSGTNVSYVLFTTSSNTFGTPALATTFTFGYTAYDQSIAVDSSSIPHITYKYTDNGSNHSVRYTNRIGGTWKTPVVVETVQNFNTTLAINEDDIPEIAYINVTGAQLTAAVGNVNNAASFTLHDIDSSVNITSGNTGSSIAVDASGNTWVAYLDDLATDYITLVKHNDADAWTTWQTPFNNTNAGNAPSITISGSDIYVFYEDELDDIKYDKYNGTSWLGETNLATGTYSIAIVKWSYLYNNSGSTKIDFMYSDTTDLYFNSITLAIATTISWQQEGACAIGKCLKLSGSSDYISRSYASDTELNPSTTDMTVSVWFRHPSTTSGQDTLLSRYTSTGGYKVYMKSTGVVCWGIDDDSSWSTDSSGSPDDEACSTTTYTDSKWHLFEGVKSGTSSITTYVDGKQAGQDSSLTAIGSISGSSPTFYVGIDSNGSSNPWDGYLDEIKVYNYAKSATQVKADFNAKGGLDQSSTTFGLGGGIDTLSSGLVGYWKMDENTGTSTADSSGNNFTGTLTNGPTWTGGKFGTSSVSFDGGAGPNADVIDLGDQTAFELTTFTISGWIYRAGACQFTNCPIFSKGMSTNTGYSLELSDSSGYKARLSIKDGLQAVTGTTTINTNTWYHVAASIDGKTVKVYVNGILETEAVQTQIPNFTTETAKIGNRNTNVDLTHNGRLDDIRIYNRALSVSEISSLYDWAPGPVGYWNADEGSGTTISDSSGNSNTSSAFTGNTAFTSGKYGKGLIFDGTDDVVRVLESTSTDVGSTTSSYSVSTWFKTTTNFVANAFLATKNAEASLYPFILYLDSAEEVCFEIGDGTNFPVVCSAAGYNDGKWHYATGVRDVLSDTITIYIDGVKFSSATDTTTGTTANNGDIAFGNGGVSYVASDYTGSLDDMKIYNYARTPKQIVSDMNGGHPSVGSPVGSATGWWSFDEGYGTTVNDKSINDNDLTMAVASWTNSGKFEKAYRGFDGGQLVSRADDSDFDMAAADNFSISTWVKSAAAGTPSAQEFIFSKSRNASAQGYRLYFGASTGYITFAVDDDTSWTTPDDVVASTTNYYDATWHHVVATKTGTSKIELYIDGRLASSKTSLTATGTLVNAVSMCFGDGDCTINTADELLGEIDESKIYRYALNADEVKVEYNQGKGQVMGALSTTSGGVPDNSSLRSYCVPGSTDTCLAPVGEWLMQEGSSTSAFDTSGNGNTATLTGGASWGNGKIGKATTYNDSGQYLDIGNKSQLDFANAQDFSIEAWFNRTSAVTSDTLFAKKNSTSNTAVGYLIYISNTVGAEDINFEVSDGTNDIHVDGAASFTSPGWHHVVAVYDDDNDTNTTVYVDGLNDKDSVNVGTLANVGSPSNALSFRIGAESDAGNVFNGLIDSLRVYNYALTPAQVRWSYNRGGPIAWWKFDECTGTTLNDATTRNTVGTWNGSGAGSQTSAGTCTTASTAWGNGVTGKNNSALNFDGTDDYITTANLRILVNTGYVGGVDTTINKLSWGAWIKPTTTIASKTVIHKDKEFQLTTDANSKAVCSLDISAGVGFSGTTAVSTSAISLSSWTNVYCTYDGTTIRMHINGLIDPAATTSLSGAITPTGTTNVRIGRDQGTTYFSGMIDDVRIYNYDLTTTQIKTLYNENFTTRFGPATGAP
ncbi:MAG: DUF2341 domain-containing protein [bacterium]|nr:DUF2341 domain-containing protein [bacterium]